MKPEINYFQNFVIDLHLFTPVVRLAIFCIQIPMTGKSVSVLVYWLIPGIGQTLYIREKYVIQRMVELELLQLYSVLDQICHKLSRKYLLIYNWVAEAKEHFSCLVSF